MRDEVRETRAQAIITLSLGEMFDEAGKANIKTLWEVVRYDIGFETFDRIMNHLVEAEIVEVEGEWVMPLDIVIGERP